MLISANNSSQVSSSLNSDIVIVGAGTVGLFIADCVRKKNPSAKIIIIECGSEIASRESNINTCKVSGKNHYGVEFGRAFGLGGTSTLWGGQLAELDSKDVKRNEKPWPISYKELKNLYSKVYKHFNLNILSQDTYRKRLGDEKTSRRNIERFFTYWLPEPNFTKVFRSTILSKNILLITNLTANDINFNKKTATEISAVSKNGRSIRIKSNKFIFAAGTISLCRFFLTTQCKGKVPWAFNKNIGRYFQDHLGGDIAHVRVLDEIKFRNFFENALIGGLKLQPKLKLINKIKLIANVSVSFSYDSDLKENFENLKRVIKNFRAALFFSSFKKICKDIFQLGRLIVPIIVRYFKDKRILVFFENGIILKVQSEQIPISSSRIKLAGNLKLSDGLYPVKLDWRIDGRELDAMLKTVHEVDKYLRRLNIAKLNVNKDLLNNKSRYLDSLIDIYHHCGGLIMSGHPNDGVVDKNCLVWGSNNVWVAGASVFPSSGSANPTLTALALAYKIANLIKIDKK
jgi:hypothetical protein